MSIQLLLAQVLLLALGLMGIAAASPQFIVDHGLKELLALLVTVVVARFPPRFFLRYGIGFWLFPCFCWCWCRFLVRVL